MRAEASLHIDAPPDRVWRLISDVSRMGEWSPITYRCEWLDGATAPSVGAKFKGYNRMRPAKWWTVCEVTASEPGKVFEFRTIDVSFPFSVGGARNREMTRWRYEFEPDGIGTKVTESYEIVYTPLLLSIPTRIASVIPGGSRAVGQRRSKTDVGMVQTLERLKAAAEEGVTGV
jgi:uncharacterized protein YndB with AHSA1/START domain